MSRDNKLFTLAIGAQGIGEGLYIFMLPVYIANLGADPVQIGFALSVSAIVMVFCYIPAGWLTQRTSRRFVLILGTLVALAAVLVLSQARTWLQIIPGLVLYYLQNISAPATNAQVAAAAEGHDLRRTYALVFGGWTLGSLISPPFGGLIGQYLGMRAPFLVATLFYALSVLLIFMLRDRPGPPAATESHARPLYRNQTFIVLCALFFILHVTGSIGSPLFSNFLRQVRGFELSMIGIMGSIASVGTMVLTYGLSRWVGNRVASLILAQASLAIFAMLAMVSSAVPIIAVACFLRGGMGAVRSMSIACLAEVLPGKGQAMGFAVHEMLVRLAFAISPYIAGRLYAGSPWLPFVAVIVLSPLTAFLTFLLGRNKLAVANAAREPATGP